MAIITEYYKTREDGVRYEEAIDPAELNRQYTEIDVSIDMIEE